MCARDYGRAVDYFFQKKLVVSYLSVGRCKKFWNSVSKIETREKDQEKEQKTGTTTDY